jgi:hypothetical protein
MQEMRRKREERVGRNQQEKEKERQELAREKARYDLLMNMYKRFVNISEYNFLYIIYKHISIIGIHYCSRTKL